MMALELHPLCTLFPRIIGPEFEALKVDILTNGLRQPIVLHHGLILDGGNRYRACIEAGVEPETIEFAGGNLVSFVLSANMHRRHLTPGQQAAIVASAQDWATAQPVGRPEKSGNVAGLNSVADRAAQSGASERTQRMADSIARQSPDLARQVAHGEISLSKALEQLAPRAPTFVTQENTDAPDFGAVQQPSPTLAAPTEEASPLEYSEESDDARMPTPLELLVVAQKKIEERDQEISALRARIELLEQGDLAAQIVALELDRDGIRNRAADYFEKLATANNKVIDYKKLIDRLRKLSGLPNDGDLVEWIKSAARSAA